FNCPLNALKVKLILRGFSFLTSSYSQFGKWNFLKWKYKSLLQSALPHLIFHSPRSSRTGMPCDVDGSQQSRREATVLARYGSAGGAEGFGMSPGGTAYRIQPIQAQLAALQEI